VTLESLFSGATASDRAVGAALGAHPKWGARDRAFFADTVYETVRWRRRLEYLSGRKEVRSLAAMHWTLRGYTRPDWADWPDISAEELEERKASLTTAPRAVRESVSDELDAMGLAALGPGWDRELTALNEQAPVFLRINPLVTTLEKTIRALAEAGVTARPVTGAPMALQVEQGRVSPKLAQAGQFEIQDAGSQQVAPFLQVEPGQIVLDLCAGAGGKTLHLAALMQNRGELHAFDTAPGKLTTLRLRADRTGIRVRTHPAEPEVISRFHTEAHRVLVDAPCTGTGTLRRHPDIKYRVTAASLAETAALQRLILTRAARAVRPGGKLVYATCSLLPAENEEQSAWFTAAHPDFRFEEESRISPAATGWDGFYMARWRRGE
jgi:16S rRNA (cytosine967-C5)-methyltransferase